MANKWKTTDAVFSKFIRKRAMHYMGGCEYCGKSVLDWRYLDCSHFIGRWVVAVRFDPDNGSGLCRGCHDYLGNHPYAHTEWFKKRLGSERFEQLNIRAQIIKKQDELAIRASLKEKIKLLEGK